MRTIKTIVRAMQSDDALTDLLWRLDQAMRNRIRLFDAQRGSRSARRIVTSHFVEYQHAMAARTQ